LENKVAPLFWPTYCICSYGQGLDTQWWDRSSNLPCFHIWGVLFGSLLYRGPSLVLYSDCSFFSECAFYLRGFPYVFAFFSFLVIWICVVWCNQIRMSLIQFIVNRINSIYFCSAPNSLSRTDQTPRGCRGATRKEKRSEEKHDEKREDRELNFSRGGMNGNVWT